MHRSNINRLLISVLVFAISASVSYSNNEVPQTADNSGNKQPDMVVTCPVDVLYRLQDPPDWSSPTSQLRLPFESAAVFEKILSCTYEKGGLSATIIRVAPQGHECTANKLFGVKDRQITCRRNVPPIKIRPKN